MTIMSMKIHLWRRRKVPLSMLAITSSLLAWRLLQMSWIPTQCFTSILGIDATSQELLTGRSQLTYASSPPFFVDLIADCLESKNCHILYYHVQKTGGSSVASRLFPLMENREYNSSEWCCNEKLLLRFRSNPVEFCSHNLSVFEVKAPHYQEILETCRQLRPLHKYLALISIREPIQRTLSMIHHQCNKNFYRKNQTEQLICQNCTYSTETAWFWDQFTAQTNIIYKELMDMVQNFNHKQWNLKQQSSTVDPTWLYLDNPMIDPFINLLHKTLNVEPTIGSKNKENTRVCNFGMPSSMMKNLHMAEMIYGSLVGNYMPELPSSSLMEASEKAPGQTAI